MGSHREDPSPPTQQPRRGAHLAGNLSPAPNWTRPGPGAPALRSRQPHSAAAAPREQPPSGTRAHRSSGPCLWGRRAENRPQHQTGSVPARCPGTAHHLTTRRSVPPEQAAPREQPLRGPTAPRQTLLTRFTQTGGEENGYEEEKMQTHRLGASRTESGMHDRRREPYAPSG